MKKIICVLIVCAYGLLAGCGGSYNVTRTAAKAPEQIRTASFSRQDGNSPEVTGYVTEALAGQGVVIKSASSAKPFKSSDVDALVTYTDVWRWDLAMFLKSISINLYNANTGELLVTGRWGDSVLHGYHRGESVSKQLIDEMFAKLDLKRSSAIDVRGDKVAPSSNVKGTRSDSDVAESSPNTSAVAPKPKASLVSRNEYEARQQARTLECRALDILAIEGAGSPREEITFDCGEGRKVTIVCRSMMGCT